MRAERRLSAFTVALALLGLLLLFWSVPELGPTVKAARADGVSGVFTARELRCIQHPGHESCVWAGDFASGDGRIQRHDVELYGSDRTTLAAGRTVQAVDTGRASRVYGPGGSGEWLFTTLLALAGAALVAVAARRVWRGGGRASGHGASADGASADGASADGASADGASADGASADGEPARDECAPGEPAPAVAGESGGEP
ncbi:hypothetical protein [Nonomuraea gerenzanensis]|uniref:Uncharacterized protein n=1 Tax=Nonomuraea gerenzanensis TaxID=93944 RepID=A0A1M4EA03_9ACTN|nr:hypothetical protein [Nonomuraea gerenzanensis]UBU17793.1 hypothetical protein LCN96_23040 [Nonomuraea gerenzanensis]SBO95574.1 hypothetical protein BN4615_P5090 [Nonomuraea gerenzanensis]